jgi:hypothetical protein
MNISLGLKVPDSLPVGNFPRVEDVGLMLSDADIRELANQPSIFDDPSWLSNQNPYNSCCSHAFNHAAERQHYRNYGVKLDFQPHFLYAHINGNRDEGALLVDGAKKLMEVGGVPLLSDAPDNSRIYLSQYSNREQMYPTNVKGNELYEVRNEKAMLSAMARRFSIVVAVHVDNEYVNNPNFPKPNNGPGNHAICLDDYKWNDSIGEYQFRNPGSWGGQIGNKGFWFLTWKRHLANPNNYHVFYAIPGVSAARLVEAPPTPVSEG